MLLLALAQSWQHLCKTDCDKTTTPGSSAQDKTTFAPDNAVTAVENGNRLHLHLFC